MPFLKIKVSCPLLPEQEVRIKELLGKAIERIPGKTEEYLLLSFESECRLWLRGRQDAPIAYLEAAVFGNEAHAGNAAFAAEAAKIFESELHIPPENFYIRFEDISAWSIGEHYIDRRMLW